MGQYNSSAPTILNKICVLPPQNLARLVNVSLSLVIKTKLVLNSQQKVKIGRYPRKTIDLKVIVTEVLSFIWL